MESTVASETSGESLVAINCSSTLEIARKLCREDIILLGMLAKHTCSAALLSSLDLLHGGFWKRRVN